MSRNSTIVKPLSYGLAGIIFKYNFELIERGYRKSVEPFEEEMRRAEEISERLTKSRLVELDRAEENSDDYLMNDQDEYVYSIAYEADRTASLIRESFFITLFHFWERQSNLWLGARGTTYNHDKTMLWLQTNGRIVDDKEIKSMELAAHCLKHGPGRSCDELRSTGSRFFGRSKILAWEPKVPNIYITSDIMDAMFDIVKTSGPA